MPYAFKSFVELFCSTLCQEYTNMSKIKRNTVPLITRGPLQAFDVEPETAGLCVSVCVWMPSSTALTGSSGDCEDNGCCLPPIPLYDSPAPRCCLTSNVFLEWHNLSYRIRTVWGAGREGDEHRLAVAGHQDHPSPACS